MVLAVSPDTSCPARKFVCYPKSKGILSPLSRKNYIWIFIKYSHIYLFKEYKEPSFLEGRTSLPSLTCGFSERRMENSRCWRKIRVVKSQGIGRLFPQESVALHSL